MQRATVIGLTLLGIAAAVLIGIGAYHAGMHHTVVQTTTTSGQVVHVVGPGYYGGWGWGFFPFGFFLFPLFFFGFIFLMRGLFWGRHWNGPNGGGYGGYRQERERMFEDWHRRQHQQATGDHPSAGGEPSSAA